MAPPLHVPATVIPLTGLWLASWTVMVIVAVQRPACARRAHRRFASHARDAGDVCTGSAAASAPDAVPLLVPGNELRWLIQREYGALDNGKRPPHLVQCGKLLGGSYRSDCSWEHSKRGKQSRGHRIGNRRRDMMEKPG